MGKKIKYSELVEAVSEGLGESRAEAHAWLRGIVEAVRDGLERDGRVVVKGLGRFELHWQEAHTGINPQTGESMEIPAHNRVHFKPDSILRPFINRKYAHLKYRLLEDDEGGELPRRKETHAIEGEETLVEKPKPTSVKAETKTTVGEEGKSKGKKGLGWLWLWILLVAAAIILVILLWPKSERDPELAGEDVAVTEAVDEEDASQDEAGAEEGVVEENERESQETVEEETTDPVQETPATGIPASQHLTQEGDALWNISDHYYDTVYLWPYIYRENVSVIPDPDALVVGVTLDIPALERVLPQISESDKERIGDGYLHVYKVYNRLGRENAYHYLWVALRLKGDSVLEGEGIDQSDAELVEMMEGDVQLQ